jgi:hypothetical protein
LVVDHAGGFNADYVCAQYFTVAAAFDGDVTCRLN